MKPTFTATLVISVLFTSGLYAQQPDRPLNPEQIREIVLTPRATSKPALKYRIYPDRGKMIDRNAATYYHRATSLLRSIDSGIQSSRLRKPDADIPFLYDHFSEWMSMPLNELPVEEVERVLEVYQPVFEEIQRARISSWCKWGIMPDRTEDLNWVQLRLDEVQHLRSVTRVLLTLSRARLAEGDIKGATEIYQTVFKIAHDLEGTGSIVGSLVGVAVAGMARAQLIEFIELPDAPNLYWPLVDLPQPVINVRHAVRSELAILNGFSGYRTLDEPESLAMTPQQWQQAFARDFQLFGEMMPGVDTGQYQQAAVSMLMAGLVTRGYPVAKRALVERGFDAERVEKMPAAQVVAIQQRYVTQTICDEVFKALHLPATELIEALEDFDDFVDYGIEQPPTSDTNLLPFVEMMFPAIQQIVYAETRTHRQLTALRVQEAIRAHADATGELPETLDDITVVPIPLNPATNQPFVYRLSDGVAELDDFGLMNFSRTRFRIRLRED